MTSVNYLVPTDTSDVLEHGYPLQCDNMGLILARYLPREVVDNIDIPNTRTKIRSDWLKQLTARFNRERLVVLQDALLQRWIQQVGNAEIFEMRARGRLIVGLGGKGALEFGITLHHTTGLPIIPGSALKGAARNFALLTIASDLFNGQKTEDWFNSATLDVLDQQLMTGTVHHPQAEAYRRAFGSLASGGECIFHDAVVSRLPAGQLFTVDVMTPHFRDYYTSGGTKPPHDGDNPNPVSFLTVSAGTRFGFAVGARHRAEDADLVRTAAQWLALALDEMGIGAKTAAGYGVFKLVDN